MSGRSSPVNGGYEAANVEPAMRLTVRKDLFPEVRLPKLVTVIPDGTTIRDELGDISCVKLETDFEQSIDDIANQKLQVANGMLRSPGRYRHRKHKQHSKRESKSAGIVNGFISSDKRRKNSPRNARPHRTMVPSQSKGGKNLNLVSSSECRDDEDDEEEESSEDEVLKCSVKLPLISMPRQSGKPYSHKLSQLSSKKSKSKDSSKERKSHAIIPCSGKPRSMLDICSSRSKKKSKKSESTTTYQSQIIDTNTIKIKIRRTSAHNMVSQRLVTEVGQRKSKKKKASTPVVSESSGEEYDPTRGDTAASMSVAAPKPRHSHAKTRRSNVTKKGKKDKTDNSRRDEFSGPQSPWASSVPEEILLKIFDYVVSTQGTLPTVIRLGRVCKLWHSISCKSELWRNVDLSQYTGDKFKTDYKLAWLLENRLSKCHTLNLAQWKVCNVPWITTCLAEYSPNLIELSVAGWDRLTPEHLYELLQSLPKLKRLDLSVTSETGGSGTCLSAASMAHVAEDFGSRLTHLTLANNKFTALQQILTSIATYCENLEVLDVSGTRATSHPAAVPLEALQKGCPKMRVFRAANAQLVLASATTAQQMEAGGWPLLEELSIAGEAAAERVAVGEYRLDDEALSRLVRGATRLRLLDLRGLQRLTDSGLVRVPAWELQHLFLGGCNVTRQSNACLELICEKWSNSLIELDLSWATAARPLDAAVLALAEDPQSKLRILNLCGSSVSLDPVKKVLLRCPHLESINLSSCRALPRGMKRLYTGKELQDLKDSLNPEKNKAKEETEKLGKKKKDIKKQEADSKSEINSESSQKDETETSTNISELEIKSVSPNQNTSLKSPELFSNKLLDACEKILTPNIETELSLSKETCKQETLVTAKGSTPTLASPVIQSKPDSSSTPRSDSYKLDIGSPYFSPVPKPDSQVQNSPEILQDSLKNNSWNLGQFKTTPTHKSEASPLNRLEGHSKMKQCKVIEQCSPTTSQENKQSPESVQNTKQDIKNPNNWNYGNYSPMPRQENQFSTQRSPYSAQPSPAQPSPYSAQPSPYSSQPSPYSAQPSPDTSQIVKPDIKSSNNWNTGNFSPMTKHPAPFSPHPSTHMSPDPGLGVKSDSSRSNSNKTSGQYSPLSRQDRHHHSPYSPRPSVDSVVYSNKKSPAMGNYSPLMRSDYHLPSPDGGQQSRPLMNTRQDLYNRSLVKATEMIPSSVAADIPSWGMERFGLGATQTGASNIDPSMVWGVSGPGPTPAPTPPYTGEQSLAAHAAIDTGQSLLHTPPLQSWAELPAFDSGIRRRTDEINDPWTLGQFRGNQPHRVHNNFVEQNIDFESLSGHLRHQSHGGQTPAGYLEDSYSEPSRAD